MTVDTVTRVVVSELDRVEWWTLRSMRLAALDDAPHAFVTTWAAEWATGTKDWLDRFTVRTWIAARAGGAVVGIACLGPPDADAPHSHFVESVWVKPGYRWRGVLRQMLDELAIRARANGAKELRLWVLDTNESACTAYLKLDFSPLMDRVQDTVKLTAEGRVVRERLMSRPLL